MEISAALAADLKALTEILDSPDVDLEALLQSFADDTKRAIDSYVGLAMTLIIDDYPVTLSTGSNLPADRAVTSLRVPLDVLSAVEPGSMLLLYAASPGAFVDLAADLSFALGLPPGTVALDEDLEPAEYPAGVDGLVELSRVNQAIGILIEQGRLPDDARAELLRLANDARTTVPAAAQHLIATTSRTQPSTDLGAID